jgi:hypothetical protein
MAYRLTSKSPHTFNAVAVRTCSPSHSPAAKKLRVSQCFQSAHQAACIDGKQQDLEQLQAALDVTSAQSHRHGIIQHHSHCCDSMAESHANQMHKDEQFSNSNRDHDSAPITTAEHCEHSTLMPQNTVPESEVYNASASGLDTVLAEATSAFAAVDSASGALLAIIALLVNWQDKAAMRSVQTVCSVLRDTIALLRGAITITAIAPAEALQATLCAARAAFDELDAICEALLAMIALLTDWEDSAIYCSRRRVIATMRATIALLSNSVCTTSSCDGITCVTDSGVRLQTVSAVTAAVQVSCDVAAAAVTPSKVPSMNTRAASNSTADAATAHARDVSTQTNEGYTSYEQLQQQVSALTAQLKKHDAECGSAAIIKETRHQPHDLWAHESMCAYRLQQQTIPLLQLYLLHSGIRTIRRCAMSMSGYLQLTTA